MILFYSNLINLIAWNSLKVYDLENMYGHGAFHHMSERVITVILVIY